MSGQPLPPGERLKPERDRIPAQGYVVTHSQKRDGAVGIGAPIRHPEGRLIGSFCITVPEIRFDPASGTALGKLLRREAASYSHQARAIAGHADIRWP